MALFKVKPQFRRRGKVLSYYGTILMPIGRSHMAMASNSNWLLIGGGISGYSSDSYTNNVVVYDSSFTRHSDNTLYEAVYLLSAGAISDKLVFVGGEKKSGCSSFINVFTSNMTRYLYGLNTGWREMAVTNTGDGNYILCAGGTQGNVFYNRDLDYYNNSFTHGYMSDALYSYVNSLNATHVGNYAIFAGGYNDHGNYNDTIAYNNSLTRVSNISHLTNSVNNLGAATINNYALFAGGRISSNTFSDVVDVFNTSLTKLNSLNLSTARNVYRASVSMNDFVLFGSTKYNETIVDAYDKYLVRTVCNPLSYGNAYTSAINFNNYALFGGYEYGVNQTDAKTLDVYQVA